MANLKIPCRSKSANTPRKIGMCKNETTVKTSDRCWYWPVMSLKTLSTSNPLELQGSVGKPLQISSGLPEGLQLAELESQMKISPLNRSSIFKCKKKKCMLEWWEGVDHYIQDGVSSQHEELSVNKRENYCTELLKQVSYNLRSMLSSLGVSLHIYKIFESD